MKLNRYHSIEHFFNDTIDLLAKYEIQNNLIIGNCLKAKSIGIQPNWFMATVVDQHNVIKLVTMISPPYPLLLFEVNNEPNNQAIEILIQYAIIEDLVIPGIVAEKELTKRFIQHYTNYHFTKVHLGTNLRIYSLREVLHQPVTTGQIRLATIEDQYFIPYWLDAFSIECQIPEYKTDYNVLLSKTKTQIEQERLFIYEDPYPVSQVSATRETLNGIVLSNVYTPPYYRGKGYATAMMADACQYLLQKGYHYCVLFTDLSNPTSNSIYQKVGFEPVCDFDEYWFSDVHMD